MFLDNDTVLAINGPDLSGDDRRVLRAFTDQLAVALRSRQLQAEAATADGPLPGQRVPHRPAAGRLPRPAHPAGLDQGVGHDPAGRRPQLAPDTTNELLTTIDEQADRLNNLIGNLLDMSRLQSGTFELLRRTSASTRSSPRRWPAWASGPPAS